jgi:hypothetical protein
MEEGTFIQSSHQVQQCPCSLLYKEKASASQASDIQLQNLLEALSEALLEHLTESFWQFEEVLQKTTEASN